MKKWKKYIFVFRAGKQTIQVEANILNEAEYIAKTWQKQNNINDKLIFSERKENKEPRKIIKMKKKEVKILEYQRLDWKNERFRKRRKIENILFTIFLIVMLLIVLIYSYFYIK